MGGGGMCHTVLCCSALNAEIDCKLNLCLLLYQGYSGSSGLAFKDQMMTSFSDFSRNTARHTAYYLSGRSGCSEHPPHFWEVSG